MSKDAEFNPDWASAPGDTILDICKEQHIAPSMLASLLGLDFSQLILLLTGNLEITLGLAVKLSESLGASPRFWLNREQQYRETLRRLKKKNGR